MLHIHFHFIFQNFCTRCYPTPGQATLSARLLLPDFHGRDGCDGGGRGGPGRGRGGRKGGGRRRIVGRGHQQTSKVSSIGQYSLFQIFFLSLFLSPLLSLSLYLSLSHTYFLSLSLSLSSRLLLVGIVFIGRGIVFLAAALGPQPQRVDSLPIRLYFHHMNNRLMYIVHIYSCGLFFIEEKIQIARRHLFCTKFLILNQRTWRMTPTADDNFHHFRWQKIMYFKLADLFKVR